MVEREPSPSLKKTLKARLGASFRMGMRLFFDDIPFHLRAKRAPRGRIVRNGEVETEGRVVQYSGDIKVIFTDKEERIFPNETAGDKIERLPSK